MKFSDKVLSMIYVNYILIIYKIVFGLIWFFLDIYLIIYIIYNNILCICIFYIKEFKYFKDDFMYLFK